MKEHIWNYVVNQKVLNKPEYFLLFWILESSHGLSCLLCLGNGVPLLNQVTLISTRRPSTTSGRPSKLLKWITKTNSYHSSDTRHMWQGGESTNTDPSLPDELNLFSARFDRENSEPTTKVANHPEHYVLQLTESEVRRTFRRVKVGKEAGPGLQDLRVPAGSCVHGHFQRITAAVCFKQTTIVPLPKKTKVTGLNDYHPVV